MDKMRPGDANIIVVGRQFYSTFTLIPYPSRKRVVSCHFLCTSIAVSQSRYHLPLPAFQHQFPPSLTPLLKDSAYSRYHESDDDDSLSYISGQSLASSVTRYRYENGRQVWQDQLQRTSISTSVSSLSDIDADPVIDNGQVFAIGAGGRMVALDIVSGQRIWELNIAGIATPWLAGDWLFVVTDDSKLIAIAKQTGKIRWINQLPQFEREKSRRGQISYLGPIMAGGRLILVGSNGTLINFDPDTGNFQSQTRLGSRITLPPVVANSTLYVLDDAGQLHAFR